MMHPLRSETERGLEDLQKRLTRVGIKVIDQHRKLPRTATYLAIGSPERFTDVVINDEFLDDLPNSREYQTLVDSYAHAVAGRVKCDSPEIFYCASGVPIRVSFRWPIQGGIYNGQLKTVILMDVANQLDGRTAKCAMELQFGGSVFDTMLQAVNSVREAIDQSSVTFYDRNVHQEIYEKIVHQQRPSASRSQPEIEKFLAGKAYTLGFLAVEGNEPREIWPVDPWDAHYLGVTAKELSLAMRVLLAKGLLTPGSGSEYAAPTNKLLAEQSAGNQDDTFQAQQKPSRSNLPTKDQLLKDSESVFQQHPASSLIVLDLDNFKTVNDTNGHPAGDACLDSVVSTIADVIGRRGRIYRWGSGDEFAILLPDFSSDEATATAERIRKAVENSKPGGDIAVTTSIGVCGTDRGKSNSTEEILSFADKAMYESKQSGKNRVTAWSGTDPVESKPTAPKPTKKAIRNQLALFLKDAKEIQHGLHYSNFDCFRQKQEWEQRVEKYLEENLDQSYAIRFQSPGHPAVTYPEGINEKMKAPWAETGAKMAMLNSFMAELRD
jgi:diguanylate cyclase (GGDEF)-like protein